MSALGHHSKIKPYRTASHQKRISRPTDLELLYIEKVFQNRRLGSMCSAVPT